MNAFWSIVCIFSPFRLITSHLRDSFDLRLSASLSVGLIKRVHCLYVCRAKVEQQGRQAISNDNGNNRGPTLSSQNYLSSRKPSSDICQSALIEFPSPLLTIRSLVGDLSWLPLSRCSVHGLHFMHRSLFYNDST